MKSRNVILLIALAIIITGIAYIIVVDSTHGQSTSSLRITTDENSSAAQQLFLWLVSKGYDVEMRGDDGVRWKGKFNLILKPKVSRSSLDRIVVYTYFTVEEEYKSSIELIGFTLKLNREFNIGSFSLDSDTDLMVTSQITFVDLVEEQELVKFRDWFETSMVSMVITNDDVRKYLK